MQETFLRTWLKAPAWESREFAANGASFTTWLTRVLINQCIDRRRRPTTAPIEAAADIASDDPGGYETLARHETAARVRAAVAELPPRQRAALTLCHWDGMTNIEAARALDISIGALESLLVRARQALRAALGDMASAGAEAESGGNAHDFTRSVVRHAGRLRRRPGPLAERGARSSARSDLALNGFWTPAISTHCWTLRP